MNEPDGTRKRDWPSIAEEIRKSTRPEADKLAYAFGWITSRIIEDARGNIELARAMEDQEALVKEQIKLEAIKHARAIFQNCHKLATGRKAWNE